MSEKTDKKNRPDITAADPEILSGVRLKLIAGGYTFEAFRQMGLSPGDKVLYKFPLLILKFKNISGRNLLFRLFYLGLSVRPDLLGKIFTPRELAYLQTIGILKKTGRNKISSVYMITPLNGFFFFSDFYSGFLPPGIRPDLAKNSLEVFPVAQSTLDLWNAVVKRPYKQTLDLCTGCGTLAILISEYSDKVTGIDRNPAAVNLARFNALFNKVKNVRFLCGDLYGPVNNLAFDLILANPPYQIREKSKLYRFGGPAGDRILAKIIGGLHKHLTPSGLSQIITEFFRRKKNPLKTALGSWLEDHRFQILFLEKYRIDPCRYAYLSTVNRTLSFKEYSREASEVLNQLMKINCADIRYGVISIKKSTGYSYTEKPFETLVKLLNAEDSVAKHFKVKKSR